MIIYTFRLKTTSYVNIRAHYNLGAYRLYTRGTNKTKNKKHTRELHTDRARDRSLYFTYTVMVYLFVYPPPRTGRRMHELTNFFGEAAAQWSPPIVFQF